MTKLLLSILIFLIGIGGAIAQSNANAIIGKWHNADSTQVVEFKKEGNKYHAKIIFLNKENADYILDINNKDESLQHRKVIGLNAWTDFEYLEDKGIWKYGQIYNYTNGNTYTGKIQINENELKLTGYYGFFFFLAKSQKWYSVKK